VLLVTLPDPDPFDCFCGRQHATWWRTVPAPSCRVTRFVEYHGLILTEWQWDYLRTLLKHQGVTSDHSDHDQGTARLR
jgi:hypothetical protein